MADPANSIESFGWNDAVHNLTVAQSAYAAVQDEPACPSRDDVERSLRRAEQMLYATPAPDLKAVALKLTTAWGEQALWAESSDGSHKRKLIGDLKQLELTLAGVPESEASGRSFEQLADNDGQWVATIREYAQLEQLLMEGPSEDWGTSRAADLVAAMDEADGLLLSLAAPTLEGVVRKLSILWEDELYDPAECFACHAIILDLRQLSERYRLAAGRT